MKIGDRVGLKDRSEVTGKIVGSRTEDIWGADYTTYQVEYDDTSLVPNKDWHEEALLELLPDLPKGSEDGCECGVSKVMPNGKHSDYCKLYRR